MTQTEIDSLTDVQAQQILVELYELLPGEAKPDYDELSSLLGDVCDEAGDDVARPLARLDDSDALRGELARRSLTALALRPELHPLLATARTRAEKAHMSALPELMAGVVVILALVPSHIEKNADGDLKIQWNQLQHLASVLKPVAEIVKSLPKSLLDKLG